MRKLVALLVLSCFAPVYVLGSVDFEIVHAHHSEGEHCHFFAVGGAAHSQHDAHDCHHDHAHTCSDHGHDGSDETPDEKPESPLDGEPAPHHHVISLNLDFAQPIAESLSLRPDAKPEGRIHSEDKSSPEEPYLEINKPPQQA